MINRFNFKIWDIKNKRITHPDANGYFYFDNEDCAIDGFGNLFGLINNETKEDYILIQSTNCHDSHYKEIFEGDIIKETKDDEHYICEVKYDDYLKQFRLHRFNGRQSYLLIDYDYYGKIVNQPNKHDRVLGEIIGNIYESPELMEK